MMEALRPYTDAVEDRLRAVAADLDLPGRSAEEMAALLTGGKMLRGSLLLWSHDAYGGDRGDYATDAAAALETIHTGLLLHDDVIDHDDVRRGEPTVEYRFREDGRDAGAPDPEHYGRSMAICVSDVMFFEALRRVADGPDPVAARLSERFNAVFAGVGRGEMRDVHVAETGAEPDAEDILSIYREKTARYSVALPLVAGATAAGADPADLDRAGELLGVAFQLKDDELDLLGSDLGKPGRSDLREGRRTLHRRLLLDRVDDPDGIRSLLAGDPSPGDLGRVVDAMRSHDVIADVRAEMEDRVGKARDLIDGLDLPEERREELHGFADYMLERER